VTGEDPHLGAVMAARYVRGVQSEHVMAVVKHYILNNQETNRQSVNAIVDERTLHEIYLPPFVAALKEGTFENFFSCSLSSF
jgi:beta-glucosidase